MAHPDEVRALLAGLSILGAMGGPVRVRVVKPFPKDRNYGPKGKKNSRKNRKNKGKRK